MDNIIDNVKSILKEYPSESGRSKIVVRVASWTNQTKKVTYPLKLEFRQFYKSNDEWVRGKIVGIGSDIIKDLLETDILKRSLELIMTQIAKDIKEDIGTVFNMSNKEINKTGIEK
jgi:hypothetical protein